MEYILHIGFHKTGTTSIQAFLQRNIVALQKHGLDFYQGMVFPENHVELHAASMRAQRQSGYKNRVALKVDAAYVERVRQCVFQFVQGKDGQKIIFSSEGLSLLRYVDELETLKSMFPPGRFQVVVYLRNKTDYLRSYTLQLKKNAETLPKLIDKESFAYTEPDTWLLNYEERLSTFKQIFGESNVHTLDYDAAVQREANVIPSFIEWLGLADKFESSDWEDCFHNRTKPV
jgi:hypothetical protein